MKELEIQRQLKSLDSLIRSHSKLAAGIFFKDDKMQSLITDWDTDRIQIIADNPYQMNFILQGPDDSKTIYHIPEDAKVRQIISGLFFSICDEKHGIFLWFKGNPEKEGQ